jgi:hypothetical protein
MLSFLKKILREACRRCKCEDSDGQEYSYLDDYLRFGVKRELSETSLTFGRYIGKAENFNFETGECEFSDVYCYLGALDYHNCSVKPAVVFYVGDNKKFAGESKETITSIGPIEESDRDKLHRAMQVAKERYESQDRKVLINESKAMLADAEITLSQINKACVGKVASLDSENNHKPKKKGSK